MRHVWSLVSGIAAAAAVLVLFSADIESRWTVVQILLAGLLLGLVATLRISPVGPIVGGLMLLAPMALLEIDYGAFRAVFYSDYVSDLGFVVLDTARLGRTFGLFAMAGAMMIVAAASRQRWLAWPQPVDALVDNGPAIDLPVAAHDGTTAQLWAQPR